MNDLNNLQSRLGIIDPGVDTGNEHLPGSVKPSSLNDINYKSTSLPENFSLSEYDDDDDDSGFCCPCCLPR